MKTKPPAAQGRTFPEYERAIGRRAAAIRRYQGISQARLAERLGLTRAQLASIEIGRVPMRYATASELCEALNINPTWLATGKGGRAMGYADLHYGDLWPLAQRLRAFGQVRFSEVWARWGRVISYPSPELEDFERLVAGDAIGNSPSQSSESAGKTGKNMSVGASLKRKGQGSQSEVEILVKRLKRVLDEPGKKASLALQLGVAQARISEWLSGKKEPGGEVTLRLLHWVEDQERRD